MDLYEGCERSDNFWASRRSGRVAYLKEGVITRMASDWGSAASKQRIEATCLIRNLLENVVELER
jgi:hypothetical protein